MVCKENYTVPKAYSALGKKYNALFFTGNNDRGNGNVINYLYSIKEVFVP